LLLVFPVSAKVLNENLIFTTSSRGNV